MDGGAVPRARDVGPAREGVRVRRVYEQWVLGCHTLIVWESYQDPSEALDDAHLELRMEAAHDLVVAREPTLQSAGWSARSLGKITLVELSGRRFLVVGADVRELPADELSPIPVDGDEASRFETVVWPGPGRRSRCIDIAETSLPIRWPRVRATRVRLDCRC